MAKVSFCSNCGDDYPTARRALGYHTCLPCGDTAARAVRHCVVPMNKSNYTVITNQAELAWLNPKRTGD
jgi:ribosomal protein L37AE/L43A